MSQELHINYPDPGFWTETSLIQLGYGIWVNLSMVTIGLAYGFSAVTLPQLQLPESLVKVSLADESWIASVLSLASPVGCLLCGYLIDRFGRRTMLIYSQLPVCLGWLFTGVANSAKHIIIGRIITGVGTGMVMCVPRIYMTEVSLPNMRGVIGSFPNIAMSIGITIQAALGSVLKWSTLCYVSTVFTLSLCLINLRLPETPYYLLEKATMEDAKASLKKFRSKKYNIEAEMEELEDFKNDNDIHKLSFKEQLMALLKRSSYKPFYLMTVYIIISQLSGSSVILMWTVDILERSKSSVNAEVGNVALGITRIVISIFTAALIFHIGRRPLAIISGLGVGIVCISLALLIRYEEQSTILPQIGYMIYMTFVTMGYYTLPPLIMYELYPLQVRGLLGGISISNLNLFIFGSIICYPYVRDGLGFSNTILTFGICSLTGCIFLYFCLPETKELTLQEIEEYYNDRRPTLTSQRRLISMQLLSRSTTSSRSLDKLSDRTKKGESRVTFRNGSSVKFVSKETENK
ncbi:unnamed protein product [Euphydryas editha]|uniref:Major facilitator superfamily (MFS) profile domain-containing protein n=1 Tax=Euphydryas editha TaxID=104508 RepID=A0AAU9VAB1_EUPED|nr:unnamed protein product [Euphydryas editha]